MPLKCCFLSSTQYCTTVCGSPLKKNLNNHEQPTTLIFMRCLEVLPQHESKADNTKLT